MMLSKLKRLPCLLFVLFLAACSSKVMEDYLYVLPNPAVTPLQPEGHAAVVELSGIHLADYLTVKGLVMETGSNSIQITQQHRWAEPLDEGIRRYLHRSLSGSSKEFRLKPVHSVKSEEQFLIHLEFDSFQSTGFESVSATGRWIISSIESDITPKENHFNFVQRLKQRNYEGMIESYALILDQLAIELASELEDLID